MQKPVELFPETELYDSGYLPSVDGHEIYYEQCGNPNGHPVLFFHGGPGAGCDVKDRKYFDPKKWRVILHDQRGCGRSEPFGEIKNNTTQDLVKDAKRLTDHLGISKAVFWGGSWGSTMALLTAIEYPELVSGMVLRGIFLGERGELDYSINGLPARHYPEKWFRFIKDVPLIYYLDPVPFFLKKILYGTSEDHARFSRQWSNFEDACLRLVPLTYEEIEKGTSRAEAEAIALLETYYFVNNCFIENGFILKNVYKIPKVPVSIIHGRYDVICPAMSAWKLRQALEEPAQLHIVESAGHSKSDPEMRKMLLSETERIYEEVAGKK